MLDKLMKMKKMKGEMPEHERAAKMSVMKELRDQAGASMADKLHGLKKVSVMSDSEKGLEKGLDKAKSLVEKGHESAEPSMEEMEDEKSEMDMHPEEEMQESPMDEAHEQDKKEEIMSMMADASPEDLDNAIMALQRLKEHKEGR